jgi:hypothetical protein
MPRHPLSLAATAILSVTLAACASGQPARPEPPAAPGGATAAPIPPEVLANWEQLIGTWIADNTRFRSEQEPFDAYGIDWNWGQGNRSLTGRLYGLQAGRDIGTFWQFREFWHPGEAQVIAMQFGSGGVYGAGPHRIEPDGTSEMLQTFFDPSAGTVERVGHRSELRAREHVTRSFNVSIDGTWTPRREYTWVRQSP